MLNKDFLKDVFVHKKRLLKLHEVNRICVPLYDELSVVKLWPMMKKDEDFMMFFPTKMPKGRVPDREYFFNILNTFQGEYLQQLIAHAQEQRHKAEGMARANETIEISEDWWHQLQSIPFISRMSQFCFCFSLIFLRRDNDNLDSL